MAILTTMFFCFVGLVVLFFVFCVGVEVGIGKMTRQVERQIKAGNLRMVIDGVLIV